MVFDGLHRGGRVADGKDVLRYVLHYDAPAPDDGIGAYLHGADDDDSAAYPGTLADLHVPLCVHERFSAHDIATREHVMEAGQDHDVMAEDDAVTDRDRPAAGVDERIGQRDAFPKDKAFLGAMHEPAAVEDRQQILRADPSEDAKDRPRDYVYNVTPAS